MFVRNALEGIGAKDRIRLGCSGKIVTAFDMAVAFSLGADWCNSARGFMFALGCIQLPEAGGGRFRGPRAEFGNKLVALVVEQISEHHAAAAAEHQPRERRPEPAGATTDQYYLAGKQT